MLLGERGQGKTRLIRTLVGLLDEWTPVLAGSELNEHPLHPISAWAHRQIAEHGDATPVGWLHRSDRYGEKLATPDTSVGDLIGDVDPIKVAEGRTLGDPETVHYGLVPRTNRGIFSVNELPDLAERIQVALLNVLEERDIQIRGYRVRLPLDLLLVASANPEDYTNRGRIITPLKDRFGAEVRTHYPIELADEIRLLHQEALLSWGGGAGSGDGHLDAPLIPDHLGEIVARFTRLVRESSHVDQRSGVSARFAIAGLETIAASAVRRAAVAGETRPVARVVDLPEHRAGQPGQGRVRRRRQRPGRRAGARGARAPAAAGHRPDLPRALRRTGPDRAAGALHRRRHRRVRRAGPRRRRCSDSWAPSRGWPSCSAGSGCPRASSRPSRRRPRWSSPWKAST